MKVTKLISLTLLFVFICSCTCKNKLQECEKELSELKNSIKLCGKHKVNKRSEIRNNNTIKDSLTASIIIDDNLRHQSIFASQNYETFYSIYAKFLIDSLDSVYAIDLRIVNYKGPLNIGFFENNSLKTKVTYYPDNHTLGLLTFTQGMSDKQTDTVYLENKVYKKNIKNLSVLRKLVPLDLDTYSTNENTRLKNNVFDNEFFYRDGLGNPARRNIKLGHLDKNQNKQNLMNDLRSIIFEPQAHSDKCYTSNMIVYHR